MHTTGTGGGDLPDTGQVQPLVVTATLDPHVQLAGAVRCPPPEADVTGVRALGRGVAFALRSPGLDAVRAGPAARWGPWPTRQDRARFAPHVTVQNVTVQNATVQNTVTPERARELHGQPAGGFVPEPAQVVGLDLWRCLGVPWECLGTFAFGRAA